MTKAPRALARGLALLQRVNAAPTGCAFVELREILGLPNATVSRLLGALLELDYLQRDGTRYRPGPALRALAHRQPMEERLRRAALPHLRELRDRAENTTVLMQWTGGRAVCLERVLHPDSLVLQEPGHVTRFMFESPWGVFVLSPSRWEAAFRQHPRPRGATRTRYRRELGRLRRHGFCCGPTVDRQRLAAPIRCGETVVGALVVGGTLASLDDQLVAEVGPMVAAAATACSQDLALTEGGVQRQR